MCRVKNRGHAGAVCMLARQLEQAGDGNDSGNVLRPDEPTPAPAAPLVMLTDAQKTFLSWRSPMTDIAATQDTIRQVVALAEAVEQLKQERVK